MRNIQAADDYFYRNKWLKETYYLFVSQEHGVKIQLW